MPMYETEVLRYNILYMTEIERLKQELKKVNAEYAGIRDVLAEQRAEFGRRINEKKQAILAGTRRGRRENVSMVKNATVHPMPYILLG